MKKKIIIKTSFYFYLNIRIYFFSVIFNYYISYLDLLCSLIIYLIKITP